MYVEVFKRPPCRRPWQPAFDCPAANIGGGNPNQKAPISVNESFDILNRANRKTSRKRKRLLEQAFDEEERPLTARSLLAHDEDDHQHVDAAMVDCSSPHEKLSAVCNAFPKSRKRRKLPSIRPLALVGKTPCLVKAEKVVRPGLKDVINFPNGIQQPQRKSRNAVDSAKERPLSQKKLDLKNFKFPSKTPKGNIMPATWDPGSGFYKSIGRLDIMASPQRPCAQRKLALSELCKTQDTPLHGPSKRTFSPSAMKSVASQAASNRRKVEGSRHDGRDLGDHQVSGTHLAIESEVFQPLSTRSEADLATSTESKSSIKAIAENGAFSGQKVRSFNEILRISPHFFRIWQVFDMYLKGSRSGRRQILADSKGWG